MNISKFIVLSFLLVTVVKTANAQETSKTAAPNVKKHQAMAPPTQPFGAEAFDKNTKTTIRWLGMAGFLINSRGTTFMIDPLLEGYDMPLLMKFPILPKDVPHLDAVLATHSDNDHYSRETFAYLKKVTRAYHSTIYVDSLMKNQELPSFGHKIGETFKFGSVTAKLTPADHAWQNAYKGASTRHFAADDACGFWFNTPDGTIWAPGDSKLMAEQLSLSVSPDVILLDYSEDSVWHFGLEGSAKLLNTYPNAIVMLGHWGFVDAPDFLPFNGDPEKLARLVVNPERIKVLAPGQPFVMPGLKAGKNSYQKRQSTQ
jgi:L-ascorbate metabolism protein UlaG (beta-lactamase superfamily)